MTLSTFEKRAAASLAGVYGLRMFGLFLVLPVLSLLSTDLEGYSLFMVGLAIGIYGLGQALLQIPLGMLSDRLGRKPIIIGGLLLFIAGSLLAANAESMTTLIIGRALQGAGAIASTLMALAADMSRPELRSKMMAIIGATIGASFILALILGPYLAELIGLAGLFYLTAGLAVLAIFIVLQFIPESGRKPGNDALPVIKDLSQVLADSQLLRMNLGIFVLHALLTGVFVVIPGILTEYQLPLEKQSLAYLLLMIAGFVFMLPTLMMIEKRKAHKYGFVFAVTILLSSMLLLIWQAALWQVLLALGLFFLGFNFLEASLPAILSRLCGEQSRGTAMGVYSTSQFLGAFSGGAAGGYLSQQFGLSETFICFAVLCLIWLAGLMSMNVQRIYQAN